MEHRTLASSSFQALQLGIGNYEGITLFMCNRRAVSQSLYTTTLSLPPPPHDLPGLTELHLASAFKPLQPPQKPLHHTNDMCHATRVRMHQHRKHRVHLILADPQKPVAPEILDHAHIRVPVRVGDVREVLHRCHVFHVPVAGEADEVAAMMRVIRGWGLGDGVHPGGGGEVVVDWF